MRRALLAIFDLLLGASAVAGGVMVVPTLPLEWLARAPFPDYTIPRAALTLIGVTALAGGAGLIMRPRLGAAVSFVAGGAIAVFEIVEAAAINLGDWLAFLGIAAGNRMTVDDQYASVALTLQALYLVLGIAMMALGWEVWRAAATEPGVVESPGPVTPLPASPPGPSVPRGRSRPAA